MALSNNMNGLLDGNKDGESDDEASHHPSADSDDSDTKKKQREKKKSNAAKEKAKAAIHDSKQVIAMDQAKAGGPEDDDKEYSLFIFAPDSVVRRLLRQFISNSYFAGFIYHMIALNSLLLTLDQPSLEDKYQKKTIE